LILDAEGDADAVFMFRTGTTIMIAANVNVVLRGKANPNNIFWNCGTVFIMAAQSKCFGNVLAPSITFAIGTSLQGRSLAYGTTLTMSSTSVGEDVCKNKRIAVCLVFCVL